MMATITWDDENAPTSLIVVDMGFSGCSEMLGELARRWGATPAAIQGNHATAVVDALTSAVAFGERNIGLIPVSTGDKATGASWLTRVASHWLMTHPDIALWIAVGTSEDVVLNQPTFTCWRRVASRESSLRSPAWEEPPQHTKHLFVCRGPRCNAQGAAELAQALTTELARRDALDDPVLVAQTSCLYPCNNAPVVVIHPEDRWVGPLLAENVADFVTELLDF
ncbi:MAG: (2Fe-2S) ferredoxin domain-containing protein [Propionibacteriaceae bacterium]